MSLMRVTNSWKGKRCMKNILIQRPSLLLSFVFGFVLLITDHFGLSYPD